MGLLALVAILLGLNLTGAFKGMFGSDSDDMSVREQARQNVAVNSPATKTATNPAGKTVTPPAEDVPTGPTTSIEFEETSFDFGTIESGDKVSHTYKFKNTGTEPLIIKKAKGSCGCTIPKWPKEPIAPGATADMLVEFNSRGKSGTQNKRVTITANTNPPQTFISIKGEVTKKPGDANAKPVPAKKAQ
ncbi:MAG TPA: DUF1573 domain-containing protein [Phaeodactylibacter sp.]|nr:DUF1573 domain-containing protein [Phaeodactylibacter sp.]